MALRAVYSNSVGSNVDISSRIRAYQLSVSQYAEEGSTAITQLQVDDPEGGINILGLRTITLTETAESSNQQVIGQWFTTDREVTRGESMRTGAARVWHVNMADPNSIIARRIMRGSDANRPAETDVQRVQWLLSTVEFGNFVTTSRYVSTRFPVQMDAVDYRDQNNSQIIDDCAQASGKNYFVFWDEPVGAFGLFYDFAGSSVFRSSIQLTNVLGFVDNDIIFAVSDSETKLARDPGRVYSGVLLPYVGGEVYVKRDATAIAFYSRDTNAPSVNVKSSSAATARANRYLTDIATEADVITASFKVPLAKVNHLQVGMAVQCWFSHFPGYDTGWNWMRVLTRNVTATSEEWYTIEVELAAQVGGLDAGGGVTDTGLPVPQPPIVAPSPPQSCAGLNGLRYFYTAAGTRTALGLVYGCLGNGYQATSTTFIQYWAIGGYANEYPEAGIVTGCSEGGINHCLYSVGSTDYFPGGIATYVRFTVVGPGTLTVKTAVHPGGLLGPCGSVTAPGFLNLYRSGGGTTLVAHDNQMPGTDMTVVVPNDGFCAHYADLNFSTGPWGLVSATWAPA